MTDAKPIQPLLPYLRNREGHTWTAADTEEVIRRVDQLGPTFEWTIEWATGVIGTQTRK